ncbi:MAG TPA: DNA adenine methylase [Polyangiaceae bacterium]|nr:DNA adenine methylase [Polyangiaceae bacterium]
MSASQAPATPAPARPFLKWAGGKGQLFDQIARHVPENFAKYHEPFLGGGAMFFGLRPANARLSDINEELVGCYVAIRDQVEKVIAALKPHTYDKEHFYEVRDKDPRRLKDPARAARMIYLNKTGFNGLYRVNASGKFNVPFGRHTNPLICDEVNLRACSAVLQTTELSTSDFERVLDEARSGDFVYFDPPYVPISDTAYFTAYVPGGFGWDAQKRLHAVFEELERKNVMALLSNSDVPELRKLYAGYRVNKVTATRRINSDALGRGKMSEVVISNF